MAAQTGLLPTPTTPVQITKGLSLWLDEKRGSRQSRQAVQCITRSPVLQGHAIKSKSRFTDSYGSGAPCFLYNILSHHPDLVIIVSEIDGNQITETRAALKELGSSIPVYQLSCTYSRNA
ncbi:TRSP domain-containing protein [Brevundimonas naejangsanensis]|uniref:TRSP domain-containing protein n=1 Tax=Brevundimonas naejangsanensis TaxID=588932 RepID=UPI0026F34113|nr:TRSP domain-containing protein [Brevundimonas naejangsanensis]